MWKKAYRQRLADIEKKTRRHPSDPTDAECAVIAQVLPRAAKTGRKRATDLWEVVNAIR
jgi:putative transposase